MENVIKINVQNVEDVQDAQYVNSKQPSENINIPVYSNSEQIINNENLILTENIIPVNNNEQFVEINDDYDLYHVNVRKNFQLIDVTNEEKKKHLQSIQNKNKNKGTLMGFFRKLWKIVKTPSKAYN